MEVATPATLNISLLVTAVLSSALALTGSLWPVVSLRGHRGMGLRRMVLVALAAGGMAVLTSWIQIATLGGVQPHAAPLPTTDALLLMVALRVPLEEAAKVAVVWPLYLRRRLLTGKLGAGHALVAAAGFSFSETVFLCADPNAGWPTLGRCLVAAPAHLFFAALWGYMLGGTQRDRFFGAVWLGCVLAHGLYDYVAFEQKAAFAVALVPLALTMLWGLRALSRGERETSSARLTAYSLFEPPSVGSVRQAFEERRAPLKLHWILAGAFVNLGLILCTVALGVFLGHRFGVDFSLVDEQGEGGYVAIALVGGSLLAAFPIAGFLVARASGTRTVLEPAWAMAAAIASVLAVFSVTEPSALIIALAIAPVGFLLACGGALLGIREG